jgi:cob(I)alamin adenosyltransferase
MFPIYLLAAGCGIMAVTTLFFACKLIDARQRAYRLDTSLGHRAAEIKQLRGRVDVLLTTQATLKSEILEAETRLATDLTTSRSIARTVVRAIRERLERREAI